MKDNERVTLVARGTPMGDLMREYWVPALLSSELPQPDCEPVRVLLLGERLIAFRDSGGKVGLIDNACPHRGASLFFGRNEANGLRCVYHGWKFDAAGRCTDMPNEPPESQFRDKIRTTAYPCVERAGIVWAYLGARVLPPPLPDIEANQLPEGEYQVGATKRDCNWLQALEGDIDDSHVAYLHFGSVDPDSMPEDTFLKYATENRGMRFAVEDTEYGVLGASYQPARTSRTGGSVSSCSPFSPRYPLVCSVA
jgi:phenylpropionate dioxygenase-like ring-hydroxylating dioxygenase large terminal subunit